MVSNWIETTIGSQITLQRGFDITKTEQRFGAIPVVSSGGISSYHDTVAASGPGVVLGRKGVVGSVYFLEEDFWPHDTTLWVKDFHGNDPRFTYYFFRNLTPILLSMDVGSANPTLNRNHVHPMPVFWPPLLEQQSIAEILGSLDDKIEHNHQMNQTLESLARAIFKSWFVDFDPVRAKMEGCLPVGMNAETAGLFPDGFEESKLGKIPEGWKVEPLKQHIKAVKGLSYKGAFLSDSPDDAIPMHNLNSIYEGGGYKYEGIKYYNGEYKPRHLINAGDVIIANTEQGFDELLIGYPAIVPKYFGKQGIFSHHLYKVVPLKLSLLTSRFIYFMLSHRKMHGLVAGFSNGTTVNMLPSDGLEMPLFVVPPRDVIMKFDQVVTPLLDKQEANIEEIDTLAAMRDALLPRLMSGEVRVKDVSNYD